MSDPRNVGCLQARKSLVKLSKARYPSGISLFDDTKKQSKTMGAKPEKKNHITLAAHRIPQFGGSKMTTCTAAQTHKKFFIRKKVFHLTF